MPSPVSPLSLKQAHHMGSFDIIRSRSHDDIANMRPRVEQQQQHQHSRPQRFVPQDAHSSSLGNGSAYRSVRADAQQQRHVDGAFVERPPFSPQDVAGLDTNAREPQQQQQQQVGREFPGAPSRRRSVTSSHQAGSVHPYGSATSPPGPGPHNIPRGYGLPGWGSHMDRSHTAAAGVVGPGPSPSASSERTSGGQGLYHYDAPRPHQPVSAPGSESGSPQQHEQFSSSHLARTAVRPLSSSHYSAPTNSNIAESTGGMSNDSFGNYLNSSRMPSRLRRGSWPALAANRASSSSSGADFLSPQSAGLHSNTRPNLLSPLAQAGGSMGGGINTSSHSNSSNSNSNSRRPGATVGGSTAGEGVYPSRRQHLQQHPRAHHAHHPYSHFSPPGSSSSPRSVTRQESHSHLVRRIASASGDTGVKTTTSPSPSAEYPLPPFSSDRDASRDSHRYHDNGSVGGYYAHHTPGKSAQDNESSSGYQSARSRDQDSCGEDQHSMDSRRMMAGLVLSSMAADDRGHYGNHASTSNR